MKINFLPSICPTYKIPSTTLLDTPLVDCATQNAVSIKKARSNMEDILSRFKIKAHVSKIFVGPSVTHFELALESGVRIERIIRIQKKIAVALEKTSIRIIAPIPGKNAIGIEIPNEKSSRVYLRSLLESKEWGKTKVNIPILLGQNVKNMTAVFDLAKIEHLLIAGRSEPEKNNCLNMLIMSLLFRFSPDELKILFITTDIERQRQYLNIPHMIIPAVKDHHDVWRAIQQAEIQIHDRYGMIYKVRAKNIAGFNSREPDSQRYLDDYGNVIPQKLPILVVIVDELSDAMKGNCKYEAETDICRIAQKGHTVDMHLIIATNSLKKSIVTDLIKANFPSKIAFRVNSIKESRLILDMCGAEKLLGDGDMLYNPPYGSNMERIQAARCSNEEIRRTIDAITNISEG